MADRVLSLRELNRATLARQMLLDRENISIPAAIERLVGLQAQLSISPYIGLWTRLRDFKRDDLAALIDDHTVVKATMIRATLHLATAEDYLKLRGTIQPVLAGASESITKRRDVNLDIDYILKLARTYFTEAPRSFAEVSAKFSELMPDIDIGSIRYTIRTNLALVQVPTDTQWSYPGNPKFALAETWLGSSIRDTEDVRTLVFRYLAAFGPATAADMQRWVGLEKLKDVFETLRPELVTYRDERKRELFDLPDMPLPDGDTPAPERFLPEYDNLLLSYDKRTRILADEHRKQVYLPGLRVASTFLVDGFVHGAWKISIKKGTATLILTPFKPLTDSNRKALLTEAELLVHFAEPDAKSYEVGFSEPL